MSSNKITSISHLASTLHLVGKFENFFNPLLFSEEEMGLLYKRLDTLTPDDFAVGGRFQNVFIPMELPVPKVIMEYIYGDLYREGSATSVDYEEIKILNFLNNIRPIEKSCGCVKNFKPI
jgi:hypothetical protein